MNDVDVVVSGAGVGGLAAARAFGALGMSVLVLERRATPADVAKGELLQPESVRILQDWGALATLEDGGTVPVDRLAIRDPAGAMLLPLNYADLPGEHRQILCTEHANVLHALSSGLANGVEVRRGVAVDDVLRDAAGRVCGVRTKAGGGSQEVRAALVVAADGVSSPLRRAVGIPVHRREYSHRLIAVDLPGTSADAEVRAYLSDRGLRLVYPLPGGRTRLYVQVAADALRDGGLGDLDAWVAALLAEAPALAPLAEPLRANLHRRQILTVHRVRTPALSVPGLALVGESAHAVHPMAAQGINSSLADAEVLAGLVAENGTAPGAVDRALRTYQRTRLPRLSHTATVSHNAARMLTTTGGPARLLGRRMMRHTARNRRLLLLTTGNLSGVALRPLRPVDRLYQFGLLTDRHADVVPALTDPTMNGGTR